MVSKKTAVCYQERKDGVQGSECSILPVCKCDLPFLKEVP